MSAHAGPVPMATRAARFTGAWVAECPECGALCAYWDAEDLDDEGRLLCWGQA